MKIKLLAISFLTIMLLAVSALAQKSKIESIYTNLDGKSCKTLESETEGAGWYRGECKGVGGYKLHLTEGDIRQSIDVIAPNKNKYELDFIGHISSGFSSVGAKAEWRVMRGKGKTVTPIALIARFNVSENSEDSSIITSYLVISKITKNQICITDIVKPGAKQNEEARKFADTSADKPCLSAGN
jgi:hypothetical protein